MYNVPEHGILVIFPPSLPDRRAGLVHDGSVATAVRMQPTIERPRHCLAWWACAVAVLSVTVGACAEEEPAKPARKATGVPVRVAPVTKQEIRPSVTLVGTVEPWKRSLVAGEVAGRVERFPVREGASVKRGQLLAQLSTEALKIQLDSATASRKEGNVRHQKAKQDLERVKGLLEKGFLTRKEYDDAVAEDLALQQRLAQLDAEIRRVQDRLAKSRILAPFAGLVVREHTEIGQWVNEGGPVVEMVDLSRVQVEIPLPERYVRNVRVGDSVSALFDGLPGFEASGRILSVVAQADPAARTFPIKVKISNKDLAIKSGMVARVTLFVALPYQAVLVPKDALVLRGANQFIFLVQDGKAMQVQVRPVIYIDGLVEVTGQVVEGTRVVVQGNERLFPGQALRVLN